MLRSPLLLLSLVLSASACFEAREDTSLVVDLRVLGLSVDPPELMAQSCGALSAEATPEDLLALRAFLAPVTFRALIADAAGNDREIAYELLACASREDLTCAHPDEHVLIASGLTRAGELTLPALVPGALTTESGPLLLQVQRNDPLGGLRGLRLPLVLHVTTAEEEIYARKDLLFSCKLFPEARANLQPTLEDVRINGQPASALEVRGYEPVILLPAELSTKQEKYFELSLDGVAREHTEQWHLSWFTNAGSIKGSGEAGSDPAATDQSFGATWTPPPDGKTRDVIIWGVVRDGRGGIAWTRRELHHVP